MLKIKKKDTTSKSAPNKTKTVAKTTKGRTMPRGKCSPKK